MINYYLLYNITNWTVKDEIIDELKHRWKNTNTHLIEIFIFVNQYSLPSFFINYCCFSNVPIYKYKKKHHTCRDTEIFQMVPNFITFGANIHMFLYGKEIFVFVPDLHLLELLKSNISRIMSSISFISNYFIFYSSGSIIRIHPDFHSLKPMYFRKKKI